MTIKKSSLLVLIVMLCLMALYFFTAPVSAEKDGICGDNLTWKLDDEGVLTIFGTGEMTSHPWNDNEVVSVKFPEGLTHICEDAFSSCYRITEISFPNSLVSIDEYAFQSTGIKAVSIPDSVSYVGAAAFQDCEDLKYIRLSKGMTHVKKRVFGWCPSIKAIYIPRSIDFFNDASIFSSETVYYEGTEEEWQNISFGLGNPFTSSIVYFNCADMAIAPSPTIWLPEDLVSIETKAFAGLSIGTVVSIPINVTSIAPDAFDVGTIIISPTGSYAASWADMYGFEWYDNTTPITVPK